ncbi:MAG: ATP-dependent Clp protease ATP-binding subunit [Anaplasmataceae bacterium]|nr:ATP-dependent Clp protease ATP-binding subunit [Anaplasmataceae bacterium]
MLSRELENSLHRADHIAMNYSHKYVSIDHLMVSLSDDSDAKLIMKKCNINIVLLRRNIQQFLRENKGQVVITDIENNIAIVKRKTLGFKRVIYRAFINSKHFKRDVNGATILMELLNELDCYSTYFIRYQMNIDDIAMQIYKEVLEYNSMDIGILGKKYSNILDGISDLQDKKVEDSVIDNALLDEYCTNLNKISIKESFDNVIGREKEIDQTIRVLLRRYKRNPMLIGEPGVGKTVIVEGIVNRILSGNVPSLLKSSTIYSMDIATLLAGTRYRGDFEERLRNILKNVAKSKDIILFIDEIHTIMGAGATHGSALDASNILKPALSRGTICCIGATTVSEFKKYFSKDKAFIRRFQQIEIDQPSVDDTVKILQKIKDRYEQYHNVIYSGDIIKKIVKYASRYIQNKVFPDKAIDVLDECGVYANITNCTTKDDKHTIKVSSQHVAKVISEMARVPVSRITDDDMKRLAIVKDKLQKSIFGQDNVIDKVIDHLSLYYSGITDNNKVIGCYLFCGPTGVGKTELTIELAKNLDMQLVRFDMSEYIESHSISKLLGSPPGYVGYESGGQLSEMLNKNQYSILLLDEIEKAHSDIYNILLQILDYGIFTDNIGNKVNCSNIIVVMTTNITSNIYDDNNFGFTSNSLLKNDDYDERDTKELKKLLSPELRNRIDVITHFNLLQDEILDKIINKHFNKMFEMHGIKSNRLNITIGKEIKTWILDKYYEKSMGTRSIERGINETIGRLISDYIINKKHLTSRKINFIIKNNKIEIDSL